MDLAGGRAGVCWCCGVEGVVFGAEEIEDVGDLSVEGVEGVTGVMGAVDTLGAGEDAILTAGTLLDLFPVFGW